MVYGNAVPTPTYVATGLVNGDTLTGALATLATSASNVGSYAITQGSLGNSNYTIAYTGANLAVTVRPIAVAANAQSSPYGANPTLTYTVGGSGLVNGDTLSGALATTATTTSNVGNYAITQGTLAASSNYALTGFTGANLAVTARPITVAAYSQTIPVGAPDPAYTYSVTSGNLVKRRRLQRQPSPPPRRDSRELPHSAGKHRARSSVRLER
jgi:hypothetical protein